MSTTTEKLQTYFIPDPTTIKKNLFKNYYLLKRGKGIGECYFLLEPIEALKKPKLEGIWYGPFFEKTASNFIKDIRIEQQLKNWIFDSGIMEEVIDEFS